MSNQTIFKSVQQDPNLSFDATTPPQKNTSVEASKLRCQVRQWKYHLIQSFLSLFFISIGFALVGLLNVSPYEDCNANVLQLAAIYSYIFIFYGIQLFLWLFYNYLTISKYYKKVNHYQQLIAFTIYLLFASTFMFMSQKMDSSCEPLGSCINIAIIIFISVISCFLIWSAAKCIYSQAQKK
ncbi:hypothetical protein pb186bvf_009024 [Paramecium bursaria]